METLWAFLKSDPKAMAPLFAYQVLENAMTNEGANPAELSGQSAVLVAILARLGGAFCRETLADIAHRQEFLAETNTLSILVHMGKEENASKVFEKYGVEGALRISDPSRKLYRAFGLDRAGFLQLLNPVLTC